MYEFTDFVQYVSIVFSLRDFLIFGRKRHIFEFSDSILLELRSKLDHPLAEALLMHAIYKYEKAK